MAVTLVALWDAPEDAESFERHYADVHMPLARKLPKVTGAETFKTLGDGPYYRVALIHFASADDLGAAMGSPEGAELLEDTQKLGKVTTLVTEDD